MKISVSPPVNMRCISHRFSPALIEFLTVIKAQIQQEFHKKKSHVYLSQLKVPPHSHWQKKDSGSTS